MFIVLTNTTISPVTSPADTLSKLTIVLVAFIEYQDLVLRTSGLNTDCHVITHVTKTKWIYI